MIHAARLAIHWQIADVLKARSSQCMRAAMQMINKMYNCSHGLQPRCLAGSRCLVATSSSSTTCRRVVLRRLSTFAAAQVGIAAVMFSCKHNNGADATVSLLTAHTALLATRDSRRSPRSQQQQQRQQRQTKVAQRPSRPPAAKWAPPLPVMAARASSTPTPPEVGASKQAGRQAVQTRSCSRQAARHTGIHRAAAGGRNSR